VDSRNPLKIPTFPAPSNSTQTHSGYRYFGNNRTVESSGIFIFPKTADTGLQIRA
jgi:hypothetical protein